MKLPVIITGSGGNMFKGTLCDISPDSAQIQYHVRDGINLFSKKEKDVKDIKSLKCMLQFDLAYSKTVSHVNILALPVYLKTVYKDTLAAGMVFSQEDSVEIHKIVDFLQYQLEKSFSDFEQQNKNKTEEDKGPVVKKTARSMKNRNNPDYSQADIIIPVELEELILTSNYSKKDLEFFKQFLIHIMSSLKVIMELTRHINEKINQIEHKLTRKT